MNRRDERKAENRTKLLAAARKVFAEKGYGAATARDIVRETDLATGTFYNYFESKDAAFRAVLESFTEDARVVAREGRLRQGATLEDRVYQAYRGYFDLVLADPLTFEFLRRNADAVAMVGAESVFELGVLDLVEDMGVWIDEGLLDASLRPWLRHIARNIAGGGFQIAAEIEEDSDPDTAARFCTRLLLDGLRGLG